MRFGVAGMASRVPIVGLMPGIYQEDPVARGFCAGLDEVLAPVISTLDCLDAYLDPSVTPLDFLDWLAGWVGTELVEDWPGERKRAVVAATVDLYRLRGTVEGLRRELEMFTGAEVEITESGGVATSPVPGAALPGQATPGLSVRIVTDDPSSVQAGRVEDIVRSAKPAHVPHRVELVDRGRA